jgi:hypothetical protein
MISHVRWSAMVSMQNKGSALAFLFVLIVMCAGGYAAISILTSGGHSAALSTETATPSEALASLSPEATAVPTDVVDETPEPASEVSTPVAPSPTPVQPMTPTPVPSATPTEIPSPTKEDVEPGPPPSVPSQFRVSSNERDCSTTAVIGGRVYDAAGNGLPGVTLLLYNDYGWTSDPPAVSEGPPQAGKYEFPIGNAARFHLVILDNGGQPISQVVDIDYQPDCSHRVDWQRVG